MTENDGDCNSGEKRTVLRTPFKVEGGGREVTGGGGDMPLNSDPRSNPSDCWSVNNKRRGGEEGIRSVRFLPYQIPK